MLGKWPALFPEARRNEAEFLLDARQAFHAIHEEIKKTETGDYVYILGWMLDLSVRLIPTESSTSLDRLLKEASRRGVVIRVLVWRNPLYLKKSEAAVKYVNGLTNGQAFLDDHTFFPTVCRNVLEAAKGLPQILLHLILLLVTIVLFPFMFHPKARSPSKALWKIIEMVRSTENLTAHHEKVTVIKNKDGLTAFCGGIDYNRNRLHIDDSYTYFPQYHDNACRLRGPAAFQILEKFRVRWAAHPRAREISLSCTDEPQPAQASAEHPYAWVVGTYNSPDGSERVRSLRAAYLSILGAAETFIYIEDQYIVSQEIALCLNSKIKEAGFEKVILVMQDSDETMDIMIPNRKRDEFMETVLEGADDTQRAKVLRTLIDKDYWRQKKYHPGIHAKTLVVDDEIAIIGSGNVNRRSMTCDSETSVVLFGGRIGNDRSFAQWVRQHTWQEFLPNVAPSYFSREWQPLARALDEGAKGLAQIVKHTKDNFPDVEDRLKALLLGGSLAALPFSRKVAKAGIPAVLTIERLFEVVWDYLIDPDVDALAP